MFGKKTINLQKALDMAFNKKRADDRKTWLYKYDKNITLKLQNKYNINYSDFIDKGLIHFSNYNLERCNTIIM